MLRQISTKYLFSMHKARKIRVHSARIDRKMFDISTNMKLLRTQLSAAAAAAASADTIRGKSKQQQSYSL